MQKSRYDSSMEEPMMQPRPFEQFRATMKKLFAVPKAELDAKLKEHANHKTERRAGQKTATKKV